jgi:hypothetical protein
LFCAAYVFTGFIGRDPWKSADVTAFGYMLELAAGTSGWLNPTLMGYSLDPSSALLPHWLGALAIQWTPSWVPPEFAARIPSMALLWTAFVATWYGVYYLARAPLAQPVAFAFGGEAKPTDYARALADGGLLALISCLGLAQLSHEITPGLAQLSFTAITFFGLAALPYRGKQALSAVAIGVFGLTLSGAPSIAALLGLGGAASCLRKHDAVNADDEGQQGRNGAHWPTWHSLGRLWLWFTWPIWPMALWTLWRWRHQLTSGRPERHFAIPLLFIAIMLGCTIFSPSADRSLLLALPALAALAAFALPTLGRSVGALIDWFTLLFFTSAAITIWVIWISLQTGVPAKPAANVAKLAQGFEPTFSLLAFVIALAATGIWAWLVRWRVGRHPAAIWKSLVLPAGGTALCWMLLMTLGLPTLNYARSYAPLVRNVQARMDAPGCVETYGFTRAQIAAFRFHGQMQLQPAGPVAACPWLVVHSDAMTDFRSAIPQKQWTFVATVRRPVDKDENVVLFRR